MQPVRLDTNWIDYAILAAYFVVVLGVGFAARRYIKTSLDYFLSGRSLPAWVTGLAFVSANLGATEILGMAANGAQYGVATVNYYWIGAIPAMVFLGIVMMPFYYGSKVHSVPDYLRKRKERATTLFDVRRIIGGLLGFYGVVLVIVGLGDSDAEIAKAQGVHINLWAGIGMLVVAALFWAWALASAAEQARQDRVKRGRGDAG